MGITVNSIKCPACGAALPIEEGRTQMFCSYCGTKILINNENEYIYRHIDEAGIKQAETDRMIRMRELEMEEKEKCYEKKKLLVIVGTIGIMFVIGIIGILFDKDALGICLMLGLLFAEFSYFHYDDKRDKDNEKKEKAFELSNLRAGRIRPAQSAEDFEDKDVNYVEQTLRSCGFINISTIPMNDLTTGLFTKPGKVEEISISGNTEFESSDWFSPSDRVVISYHSLRQ